MNLKTKKVIAREFLFLLLCIVITAFVFLGVYLYSFYKSNKVDELIGEIKANKIIIDSLQSSISIEYDEYGIPIRKLDCFEVDFSAFDKTLAKFGDQKLSIIEFAKVVKGKYPEYRDVDDKELTTKMLEKYPEYRSAIDGETTYLPPPPPKKIILELSSKRKLIKELTIKLEEHSKQIISSKNQARISLITFFICLSCVFFLRYLFYGVRWSLSTLKEK